MVRYGDIDSFTNLKNRKHIYIYIYIIDIYYRICSVLVLVGEIMDENDQTSIIWVEEQF